MKWLALLFILLLVPSTLAASVTVDIFGTNVSNAQSNLTKSGNNSYQVVQWAVGDSTKSLKADINGNASDSINFTLHNFTAGRVIEVKVNSSASNSYQADPTGTFSFTRVQTVRNQTYSFTSAVNSGGYNFTWFQLWTYPSLFGLNFTNYFLPYTGATADLDMNNKNITNVQTMNVTTTNVTLLNATDIQGNGSRISALNASNLTSGTIPSERYAGLEGGFFVQLNNSVGEQGNVSFIYTGTLVRVKVIADTSGTAIINVWNNSNDMTGGNNISLSSQQSLVDTTLTGWNTSVTPDTVFRFRIFNTTTNIARVSISFTVRRT